MKSDVIRRNDRDRMIDGKTVNKCIFASSAYFRTSSGHGGKFVAAARTQGRASARA